MTNETHSIAPRIEGQKMYDWATELFPICRSITGAGIRQTISYIKERHPELETLSFKTGTNVFDWTIPKEWEIRDAYIEHESGQRFAEFSANNIHVLNYSTALDLKLSREELIQYIWTQPDQPDRIPYITSYYAERAGFCMSEDQKNSLPSGNYRAYIDAGHKDGSLDLAELKIKGKSDQELFFSTYICHPSLANNELSGPVLSMALAEYIKKNHPAPNHSYRFVFVPETIGSIAYLSKNLDEMKQNIMAGFVLSCVGDDRAFSHVQSRFANTLADKALATVLKDEPTLTTYSFLKRGSDERQYCAPFIDLPVCGFCRSKYGEYPEYHTDADNLDLISPQGLQKSFDKMKTIIDAFEAGLYPKTGVLCEPQLGKRNLYSTISQKGTYDDIALRMDVLAYSDGKTDIFDLAKTIEQPLENVLTEINLLKDHGILV